MKSKVIKKLKGGVRCLKEHGLAYTLCLLLKKVFDRINKGFRAVGQWLSYGLIEIIWVHTYRNERSGPFVYLFGKQIRPRKKKTPQKSPWVDPNQPVIYLKVNRLADYTIPCIQRWVNTVYKMRADYYFICDNKQLEYQILKSVIFPDEEIKFLRSERRYLRKIGQVVATKGWQNAAYAHLTPFYHAKAAGEKNFWAIDADDTMFCFPEEQICEMLRKVQHTAAKEEISVFSLDVSTSRKLGRHWSWGIAFINGNRDYFQLFQEDGDRSWVTAGAYPYRMGNGQTNMDWYFTYLKYSKGLRAETFYVENACFIHWGNFLKYPGMTSAIYNWSQGKLSYPIYQYVICDERAGYVDIAKDCFAVDIGLLQKDSIHFLNDCLRMIK